MNTTTGAQRHNARQDKIWEACKAAQHNLDTPEGRLACIEKLGPTGYNAEMEKKFERDTVARVGKIRIRTVQSRFGILFFVEDGKQTAYATLPEAIKAARDEQ